MTRSARLIALVVAISCGGCSILSSVHPRFAPDTARSWPEVDRILVLPARVGVEVKNFAVDDYIQSGTAARGQAVLFYDAIRRALQGSGREPLYEYQVLDVLRGDRGRAEATADALLAHVRARMARDPAFDEDVIPGLEIDPETIPAEIRRSADAVVVMGGRLKIETEKDAWWRWAKIALVGLSGYPVQLLGLVVPFLLPLTTRYQVGYFELTPERVYVWVGVFDTHTGRLIYLNDWTGTHAPDDQVQWKNIADKLLDPLIDVRGDPKAPLGSPP